MFKISKLIFNINNKYDHNCFINRYYYVIIITSDYFHGNHMIKMAYQKMRLKNSISNYFVILYIL